MPRFRKDPISSRWVIIATERSKRPRDYDVEIEPPSSDFCPFCQGNEDATPGEIAVYRDPRSSRPWDVRVFPNKYPALRVEGTIERHGEGVYDTMSGVGAHEVIVESAEHVVDPAQLDRQHLRTVLMAWRDRLLDLRKDQRLQSAVVFKNHGAQAGASLEHVHSQLIALPVVPNRLQEELQGARAYWDFRHRCVFCDIIHQDTKDRSRVVYENEDVVVLTPYASRFPFEIWMLPRQHEPWYEHAKRRGFESLADALHITLNKLNRALDHPPFNLMLHSAPFRDDPMDHYHWHIEIIPTLTKVAGFEWGTGFHINPTRPEDAARHLREIDV